MIPLSRGVVDQQCPSGQDAHAEGREGFTHPSPATVFHCRTCQRLTIPLVTYGSAWAKFSATEGESPLKRITAPSAGSASAPPRTSSPRRLAAHASSRGA